MINGRHISALAASHCTANLLLVGNRPTVRTSANISVRGYAVDEVGIAEALWCWPVEGYDLVLIDATEHPSDGLELCEYIKKTRPKQKVAMLVGNRSGRLPLRLSADAVFSGEPDGPELARALNFLLREPPGPARI